MTLENSSEEILLGVTIDRNLNFTSQTICKKASKKLNAFARISHLISPPQNTII